jgi:hypothetical protein
MAVDKKALAFAIMGVFAAVILALLVEPHSQGDGSNKTLPNNIRFTTGKAPIACPTRSILERAIKYNVEGDMHAFNTLLWRGPCKYLDKGETVYLEDTKLFSGMAKIRCSGEDKTYWTPIESISSAPPSSSSVNASTRSEAERAWAAGMVKAAQSAYAAINAASLEDGVESVTQNLSKTMHSAYGRGMKEIGPETILNQSKDPNLYACQSLLVDISDLSTAYEISAAKQVKNAKSNYQDDLSKCQAIAKKK